MTCHLAAPSVSDDQMPRQVTPQARRVPSYKQVGTTISPPSWVPVSVQSVDPRQLSAAVWQTKRMADPSIGLHVPPGVPWSVRTHARPAPQSAFVAQVARTHWPTTESLHWQSHPGPQSASSRQPMKQPQ